MRYLKTLIPKDLFVLFSFIIVTTLPYVNTEEPDCNQLRPGQFLCRPPEIDPATQQPCGCKNNTAYVECYTAPGIRCKGTPPTTGIPPATPSTECSDVFTQSSRSQHHDQNFTTTFFKRIPCVSTDGHDFETALLLSVFLGMFGADRFYLGYPALGIIKFCTLGFFFLGQLIDIILIATQVVGPASGKGYVIDFYGAKLSRLEVNELTYFYADYAD